MLISDLNYLEVAQEDVTGASGVNINSNFNLSKNVYSRVDEVFRKKVELDLRGLKGNGAEVIGSSDASGKNTFTSIIFGTQTDPGRSESLVNAGSYSSYGYSRPCYRGC